MSLAALYVCLHQYYRDMRHYSVCEVTRQWNYFSPLSNSHDCGPLCVSHNCTMAALGQMRKLRTG